MEILATVKGEGENARYFMRLGEVEIEIPLCAADDLSYIEKNFVEVIDVKSFGRAYDRIIRDAEYEDLFREDVMFQM